MNAQEETGLTRAALNRYRSVIDGRRQQSQQQQQSSIGTSQTLTIRQRMILS